MWKMRIERFYHTKNRFGERLWDIERVKMAVELGYISSDDFKEITGEDHETN